MFDYVIIGAGAAGCVLANRLSEDRENSVLLVESGGSGNSIFIDMPAGNGRVYGNPKFDWRYRTIPQPTSNGRQLHCPRGKGLGGSTIMNGMIYTRGARQDYDDWADGGLTGWGYSDLLPYFKKSEANWRGPGLFHGGSGPVKISPSGSYNEIDRRFVAACAQSGCRKNADFCGPSQLGAGRMDVMVSSGIRSSAANAYLKPVKDRPNLTIRIHSSATKLHIQKNRITGVDLLCNGEREKISAGKEVLLCAGAYGSPQLLMLSGIGPGGHLMRHGIDVIADLPGVGSGLQDHMNIPNQFLCSRPNICLARWQRLDLALWLGLRYLLTRTGPGASPFWSACCFKSLDDDPRPDFQIFFTPMIVVEDPRSSHSYPPSLLNRLGAKVFARGKTAASGFQLDVNLMRPTSRGSVRLASADPEDPPVIDLNYLSTQHEADLAVKAVEEARNIASRPALAEINGGEVSPGQRVKTRDQIIDHVRNTAASGHHPVSTCRMGLFSDKMAVVDGQCKVRGFQNLRVVDASIFPSQICANPNSTINVMAEKAADIILQKAVLPRAGMN